MYTNIYIYMYRYICVYIYIYIYAQFMVLFLFSSSFSGGGLVQSRLQGPAFWMLLSLERRGGRASSGVGTADRAKKKGGSR